MKPIDSARYMGKIFATANCQVRWFKTADATYACFDNKSDTRSSVFIPGSGTINYYTAPTLWSAAGATTFRSSEASQIRQVQDSVSGIVMLPKYSFGYIKF